MWKIYHLFKVSLSAALAGIICCIGPVILFQFGIMSGIYAISFADFFYADDGSIGMGAIILRIVGVLNKALFSFILVIISISLFLTMDEFSSIYFDKYIVPQQQIELNIK